MMAAYIYTYIQHAYIFIIPYIHTCVGYTHIHIATYIHIYI